MSIHGIRTRPELSARAQLTSILQAGARIYMHIADATLETGVPTAEAAVRAHLRGYGSWRGEEMRQAHAALGGDIDMQTLMQRWDSASTYVVKDELEADGVYSPGDVQFEVHYCPASLAWKEAGFHRWGHVYCDEVHQSIASSYHPDGVVVIPLNLMKGDSHCQFRWVLPPTAAKVDQPVTDLGRQLAELYPAADTDEETGMRLAQTRTSRLIAGRFLTWARAAEEHGVPESALVEGLRRWATQRGELLAKDLVGRSAASFLTNLDLAPLAVWRYGVAVENDDCTALIVHGTPMDDLFRHYDAGKYAAMFWDAFPILVKAFDPTLECRVTVTETATPALREVVLRRAS
ncbi:hypothetical protein EFK50_08825 [Nocardioides marmoriginsengisoli]|uniref:L-2-amino-thiazoline-4-carboxylic acid hydrolase n=1 Tax=Nocardioides marmoriginsengisoli TaxID=661483 RepID=A0A3N0CEP0_9ACTN|nr:L-2-amino-thiazoline-4-carboxylic acid hydrolase [Nocardioides marmoriginsengisoli]RNL61924.1 hypothetical protein EFK50_08825 [Nocardioides marmoriginsengisoli]